MSDQYVTCVKCKKTVHPEKAADGKHCNPCGREIDRQIRMKSSKNGK